MDTRKLGHTSLDLTVIGLGTWAIGGPYQYGWGPQDDVESIKAIHRAMDLGVNWIDTAPVYGLGHSEEVVGRAIKDRRDRVQIATKCGRVWDEAKRPYSRLDRLSVRNEAESSLRRLGIDTIDLFQIHLPQPDADIEEAWEEIGRLIQEGKVRYAGVSNFSVEQIRRAMRIHPVASLQPEYSLLTRDVEKALLPFCAANNIGVIAYSPMASGLLTGKYDRAAIDALPADDWRHLSEYFQEPKLSEHLRIIAGLRPIATLSLV